MAEQLIIYLKDINSQQADWVFTNLRGEISTPVSSGTIAELAEQSLNNIRTCQKITCIIQSNQIHFSYQNIPAKNKQRALQAIPFALEEQLAEDVDELHFATATAKDNIYPVAAIKHDILRTLLDQLKQHHIVPDAIYPDISCLPQTEKSWNLLQQNDNISIDQHSGSLIHSDEASLAIILNSLLKQTDPDQLPDSINCWSLTDSTPLELPTESIETINIVQSNFDSSPISVFAKSLNNRNLVNLLQGPYKVVHQSNNWWKTWRVAAVLLVSVVTLELASAGLKLNSLETENKLLSKEIKQIYKKSFPRSKRIVNARVQMENKLKKLKKGNNKSSATFADLLASTSPIIQQTTTLEILAIDFSNNKLELEFTINNLSSVETFKSRLNKTPNIKAELVSSTSKAKLVNAKIKIEAL